MVKTEKTRALTRTGRYHKADKYLLVVIFVLLAFGLISLSSASSAYSYSRFQDAYYFVKSQLIGLLVGLAAFLILAKTDYHIWEKYAFGFLIFSLALLLLVFIPGLSAAYGQARSWINIFGFSLQPSEFVKLSFLLYLAAWLENRKENLTEFSRGILPFLGVLGAVSLLMMRQPDFGTLTIIALTSLAVYYVGGGSLKSIFIVLLVSFFLTTIMVFATEYQVDRIKCMLDPSIDPQKKCYQINQSLIAVGSGGIIGRGLGESRQKFMYLPQVYGDSIFAIIAEENGFIGAVLLLVCYLVLFYRGFLISARAPDGFGRLLAIGIVSWITIQAVINIGGIINLMPMTGVPLPFISHGGSAILAALASAGVLVNISRQTKEK